MFENPGSESRLQAVARGNRLKAGLQTLPGVSPTSFKQALRRKVGFEVHPLVLELAAQKGRIVIHTRLFQNLVGDEVTRLKLKGI